MVEYQEISAKAVALHSRALIIDAHCDILIPLTDGICELANHTELPSPAEWIDLAGFSAAKRPTPYQLSDYATWFGCAGQYDVPLFQQGGLSAQVVAVYIADEYLGRPVERAMQLIATLHREIQANPNTLTLARTPADIVQAKREGKTALLLAFEGAEPLGHDLSLLDAYYALGLRMLALTHSRRNAWADGTQINTQTGGLTLRGRQLVHRLDELGIIIDLAHLNDTGIWEVLSLTHTPPIISHTSLLTEYSGYRAPLAEVNPVHRKSKLDAIAELDGVVGILFWDRANVEHIVDDIMLVLDHVGARHVGLGSDLYSRDRAPSDLSDIGGLPRLTEELLRRGLGEETILDILGRNWLRVFEKALI